MKFSWNTKFIEIPYTIFEAGTCDRQVLVHINALYANKFVIITQIGTFIY
jgi:hypothetical protein